MKRTISIGNQSFESLRENGCFYVDKTAFIREWWESQDVVTLITRPRRFGKTLNMSMLNCFFSREYAGRGEELFGGLDVWKSEDMHAQQGRWPVIDLSFAGIKENTFAEARKGINRILTNLYADHEFLKKDENLPKADIAYFDSVCPEMDASDAAVAIRQLSRLLERHFGQKVLILLDEYDTPMQEAYAGGYWEEMTVFMRGLFNNSFKSNPSMSRAILTGITRISRESMFSDMNNLEIVTTTTEKYETAFGFTKDEVFAAMEEHGLKNTQEVRDWYDGFTFGNTSEIYNPWSIINYLKNGKLDAYWANTSSNALAGKLVREGDIDLKHQFEDLLRGGTIEAKVDEQIAFGEIGQKPDAIWSLLLASGYLRIVTIEGENYHLALTNQETIKTFEKLVSGWFDPAHSSYSAFTKALLRGDLGSMNGYLNAVSESVFSSFDTGTKPSWNAPERFYHGFVLGLIVELKDQYEITSNRESGFGRYDVMMAPKRDDLPAVLMEFKVHDATEERTLEDTVQAALKQIEDKDYARTLIDRGIATERIRKYGFAFEGKKVLIGAPV